MKLHGADFVYSDFGDQQRLFAGREVRTIVDAAANIGNTVALYLDRFQKPKCMLLPHITQWRVRSKTK
jgi:hypothetical protein